jgi:hypothetical protein
MARMFFEGSNNTYGEIRYEIIKSLPLLAIAISVARAGDENSFLALTRVVSVIAAAAIRDGPDTRWLNCAVTSSDERFICYASPRI